MWFTPLLQGGAALLQPPATVTGAIVRQIHWTRQPQGAVQIDWSNPLTRGLVICTHAGNNFRELVNNKPSTITSATYAPTKEGRALMDGASTFSIETPVTADFGEAVTWVVGARPDGTGGGGLGRFFDKRLGVSAAVEYLFFNGSLSALSYDRISNGGTNQAIYTTTSGMVAGDFYSVAVRVSSFTSNSDAAIFVNGVSKTLSTNTAGTVVIATNAGSYVLGNRNGDAARNFDGRLYFAYRWNRALTASEIAAISANPWQIFEPVARTIGAVISGVSISRPNSDITTTGWTGDPDNVTLYANIDEAVASDTDFIISPSLAGSPGPAIFGINPTQATGTLNVRLRARRTGATGDIRALLLDGTGTTIGTSAWQALTASFAQYTLSVSTTGTAARVQIEVRQ